MLRRCAVAFVAVVAAGLVAGATIAGSAVPAAAQSSCIQEQEPDDTGDQAPVLTLPGCIEGTLPDGDNADLWQWTISDADAKLAWSFTLSGITGTLTGVQLVPITSEPGASPVTYQGKTFELDAPPDATGPVTASSVLLPAGRYIFAVARTARATPSLDGTPTSDAYQVTVAAAPLPPSGDIEPNDDVKHASPVSGAFEASGDLTGSPDVMAWTLSAQDATHSWDVTLSAPPGSGMTISIIDPSGQVLAAATADATGLARLHDLRFPPGRVLLQPSGSPAVYIVRSTIDDTTGADAEPNGVPAAAIPLQLATMVTGRLADTNDQDLYRLSVDDTLAASLLDIRLIWRGGPERKVCISTDPKGPGDSPAQLQCGIASGRSAALRNLLLPTGDYLIGVYGDASLADIYRLRVDATSAPASDYETEPNDAPLTATPFPPGTVMRGRLIQNDLDTFRITITGERQLWQVRATGSGIDSLQLELNDGTLLQQGDVATDGTSAEMTDLYLVPGDHWIRVLGNGGDYSLALTPLGPPEPNSELEPNDDEAHSEHLVVGGVRTGRLALARDVDAYRFSLAAPEHLRFDIQTPSDGAIDWFLARDSSTIAANGDGILGAALSYDAQLPAGDYVFNMAPITVSQGRYRLTLTREDPLTVADDQEPNDAPGFARPLPADGIASGTAASSRDQDWYLVPPLAQPGMLQVRSSGKVTDVALSDGANRLPMTPAPDSDAMVSGTLPVGVPLYLEVIPAGDYTVSVGDPAPDPVPAPVEPLPASVSLSLESPKVAAYWPTGQVVPGTLTVSGVGTAGKLSLDAVTSDAAWSVRLGQSIIDVVPGEPLTVPVTVTVQPDASADVPVAITVRARDGTGRQATATGQVVPDRDAEPASPELVWAVPDALAGGLDVASQALGATPVPSLDATAEAALHDDLAYAGGPLDLRIGQLPVSLTVDLAGDDPVPIAGTVVDPLAGNSTFWGVPRHFQLLLSNDGSTWQPVLSGELQPKPIEQAFVLPTPVPARFARLEIDTTWGGAVSELVLGEWKVVAPPGVPIGAAPLDVADPTKGGHVVYMEPPSPDQSFGTGLLSEDPSRQVMSMPKGTKPRWVVGFEDDRAAQLVRLEWVDPPGSDPTTRMKQVAVEASLAGPLGPWASLGTWQLRRAADGSVAPFALPDGTWARFLRFTGNAAGDSAQVEEPATLRAIEAATGQEYRSVIGEWGGDGAAGPYEALHPPAATPAADQPDVSDDRATATPLALGQPVSGQVHIGQDVDWYTVTVPAGQHSLTLTLGGQPVVRTAISLYDAAGAVVPTTQDLGSTADATVLHASVTPGASYSLRVEQPPFSAMVSFDTSGSLGQYVTYLPQALRVYASGVVPGQESLGIQPFGEPPLLPDWSDDPFVLGNVAATYTPGWNVLTTSNSSAMEDGMLSSLTMLENRSGARAVLIATDAETTSYPNNQRMWQQLQAVGPQVFTVLIGGTGQPVTDRHTLQDLALVGSGWYTYARSHADVDHAFDRLATWLRRPATYTLEAQALPGVIKPPAPGSLEVVPPKGADGKPAPVPASKDVAVDIILDTSGSMLDRFGGQSRIDIAKKVLDDLVTNHLPVGAPMALRVLGDRADPCGTSVAVPFGPLDPATVTALVDKLSVVRQADTPIAAALAAVPTDLSGANGTKIVLLITDSKEIWPNPDLCGRNPQDVIRSLKQEGVDARINIVGMAVDSKRARNQLVQWAKLGGGAYFDARDPQQLGQAISAAVKAPFEVFDASGSSVATGTVGGAPVELAPGTYKVVVLSDPTVTYEAVVVRTGETLTLTLPVSTTPTP